MNEHEMLKHVGEQAWERGRLTGSIQGLIHNYKLDDSVPENVIEDLERVIEDHE